VRGWRARNKWRDLWRASSVEARTRSRSSAWGRGRGRSGCGAAEEQDQHKETAEKLLFEHDRLALPEMVVERPIRRCLNDGSLRETAVCFGGKQIFKRKLIKSLEGRRRWQASATVGWIKKFGPELTEDGACEGIKALLIQYWRRPKHVSPRSSAMVVASGVRETSGELSPYEASSADHLRANTSEMDRMDNNTAKR